jgi:FK506-binding protein 4/5
MKEGESCYIKSKIDGKGNKVSEFEMTSNSALKFNAQLKILCRAADCSELEPDECLERAQHHKDKGTELFKTGRIDFSRKRYEKAVSYLCSMEMTPELPELLALQHKTLKCQCYLNLAAICLKMKTFLDVVEQCTKALDLEPDNVKGLFRRGQAHVKLNDYNDAKLDLQKALQIEPENKAVSNQLLILKGLIKNEKDMYKKMFS